MALHRTFQKLERSLAVPALGGKDLEDLAFIVHGVVLSCMDAPGVARGKVI